MLAEALGPAKKNKCIVEKSIENLRFLKGQKVPEDTYLLLLDSTLTRSDGLSATEGNLCFLCGWTPNLVAERSVAPKS
jgi:hypothetical protein